MVKYLITCNHSSRVVILIEVHRDLVGTVGCVAPDIGLVGSLLQDHVVSIDGGETKR